MSKDIYQVIGERIRLARRGRYSQADLARHLGYTQAAISKFERGQRTISIPDLMRIAAFLDRPVSYFLGESALPDPDDTLRAALQRMGVAILPLYIELEAPPALLKERPAGYLPLTDQLIQDADFALRIDSNAAFPPDVCEGDIVLVRRQAFADKNDFVLIFSPETGFAVRRFRSSESVSGPAVEIVGRILRLVRDFS